MVVFKVAFLLGFPVVPSENQKIKKQASKTKGVKIKLSKPKKDLKVSDSKDNKETLALPAYVLDVGNPIGYAHIECRLMPDANGYLQIDIVCWKGVVKVFTEDDVLAYRVKVIDDTVWVPVCTHVTRDQMTIEELEKFHDCDIYFNIFTNKMKFGSQARLEKSTQFFLKEEDISSEELTVPVYDEDPNLNAESDNTVGYVESMIMGCILSPPLPIEWNAKLKIPDLVQSAKMKNVIDKVLRNENICCKEYIQVAASVANKANNICKAGSHKSLRGNRTASELKAAGSLQIKVSGEVLFTDPSISVFEFKNTNGAISKAFLFLGVESLMTTRQKTWMNPMIVKIKKLENLDSELLNQKNFKSVFVRYSIPGIAEVKTLEREIAETIRFDESHAYFTHNIPKLTITEFIQSNRLFLEVCGVRDANAVTKREPSIFGTKRKDKHLAKRMTPLEYALSLQDSMQDEYGPIEVLAVTACDLSSLLVPVWGYTCKESCHCPNNLLYQNRTPPQLHLDLITTNSINLKKDMYKRKPTVLTELSLLERGTSLQVEVYFMAPVTELNNAIYFRHNCYTRLLLIIYSVSIATLLLSEVLQYNQCSFTKEVVIPDLSQHDSDYVNFIAGGEEYLSGFVIDDAGTFVFFLEGIYQHKLVWLWKKYRKYSPDEMSVYFSSDFVYEKRLYKAFLAMRGICVITLQRPLRDILAQNSFYVEGHVPIPAWEAAKKLDILFRATTLKDIFQYNLLPTPNELLSLSMEWGVPVRWKDNNLMKSSKQE